MRISLFPKITDNEPVLKDFTWPEFVQNFDKHTFDYTDKNSVPAFSPAEYPPGARRAKSNVKCVHFGELDLDKLTDAQMDVIRDCLEGLEYIFYTTWSHAAKAPLWCARLIVPFTRPVLASEWDNFWPKFNRRLGGLGDPACKDPSRIYFIPAAPPGTPEDQVMFVHESGSPIDVDAILWEQQKIDEVAVESIKRPQLEDLSDKLKRRRAKHYKEMGERLRDVLNGEVFAQEGERDKVIFQLTGVLVEELPKVDAKQLAWIFTESLKKMTVLAAGCPTVEDVEAKIRRHQESKVEEENAEENEHIVNRAKEIRRAFANCRSHPYTEEELNKFASDAGISREAFNQRWIVQKGRTYYLFFNGSYLPPATDVDVSVAAIRDLAPAYSAGVDLYKLGAKGEVSLKSASDMMRDYGTVASNIVVDLTAQVAKFDDATRTFIEAPCPLRKLKPTFDPDVNEWLTWLAGDHFETLNDWLAVVTKLQEACAALYLCGAPGSGKTLLAEGLARLWTEEKPTPLEEAMGSFNQTIMTCPLVLGDETIPKDFRGRVRTAELRQFIQARSRPLSRKHIANASLRGAVRLIITANNQDLLNSNEALSTNDIQAIVDRIIYIECPPNSAKFLRSVNTRSFVAEDRIARHALWLAENRVVASGKRFLVEGSDSSLHRTLTTSSGLRSAVCNWLVSYLLSPKQVDSSNKLLIRKYEGKLLVTSRAVSQWWNTYPTNESSPTAGRVSQALAGLSKSAKVSLRDGEGHRTHYWAIDTQNLIAWADRNGYATAEVIEGALLLPTPENSGAAASFH